jgi:hypothetical protein
MKGSLVNLSLEGEKEKTEEFDLRLRELNQLFEVVHLVDLKNNSLTPMLGEYKFYSDFDPMDKGLQSQLEIIADKRIRQDEKNAFIDFTDSGTLVERIKESEQGYVSAVFHVLQKNGCYKPEEFILMPIPGSGSTEFLFCTRLFNEI